MHKINFLPFRRNAAPFVGLALLEPVRAYFEHKFARLRNRPSTFDGKQHNVIVIPGLGTGRKFMRQVHGQLQQWNYVPHDWGMGRNMGDPDFDFDKYLIPLISRLETIYAQTGQPVSVLGWSLGGLAARELAKRRPHMIHKVVTLATPMRDFKTRTNASWLYERYHQRKLEVPEWASRELQIEPPVPTYAIYSKTDGFVNWRTCIQKKPKTTRHIKLNSVSHIGMVFNAKAFSVVGRVLAPKGAPKPRAQRLTA